MKSKTKFSHSLYIVRRFYPKVTTVVDADNPVTVEVTFHDNNHGAVKSHRTCALAIACKRFFKADGVIIGQGTSYIVHGTMATRFKNTETVTREIVSFDRKAGFDVGRYNLSPPSPCNRIGAPRRGG